jgi:hypothetical protein
MNVQYVKTQFQAFDIGFLELDPAITNLSATLVLLIIDEYTPYQGLHA